MFNIFNRKNQRVSLCPYNRLLDMVNGKGSSETQTIVFDTIKAKLAGGYVWEQTQSLYRYNGHLYEHRYCKSIAEQILRFGRRNKFLPIAEKLGGKMSYADLLTAQTPEECPSLSSMSKRIYTLYS